MHPEMVTLGAGIADVDAADLLHFVQNCAAAEDGQAQRLPVPAFATSDHIVNRGEGQFLMVQVPVYHSCARLIVSPSAFQVIRIHFLQRPPVLSAARVRESWFWVSPSMGRGYPEAVRVSTAKSRPSRGRFRLRAMPDGGALGEDNRVGTGQAQCRRAPAAESRDGQWGALWNKDRQLPLLKHFHIHLAADQSPPAACGHQQARPFTAELAPARVSPGRSLL